jgi:hypothetical protein
LLIGGAEPEHCAIYPLPPFVGKTGRQFFCWLALLRYNVLRAICGAHVVVLQEQFAASDKILLTEGGDSL